MRTLSFSIFLLAALFIIPSHGQASTGILPKDYSADIVMTMPVAQPGMPGTMNTKIYKLGKKTRIEMKMQGQDIITINDGATGEVITLMPAQKMGMKMNNPQVLNNPMNDLDDGKIKPVKVGPDTIDGKATTKYEVKTDAGGVMYYWLDENDIPLKLVTKTPAGDITMEYKNVKIGAPDSSLFQVPEGYNVQEMKMPAIPSSQ